MFSSAILRRTCTNIFKYYQNLQRCLPVKSVKKIHTTQSHFVVIDTEKDKTTTVSLFSAARRGKKEKDTFLSVIYTYSNAPSRKAGHVQFIYAAMRYMDEFGVNEDIEAYKAIADILPKGRFVCKTFLQAEFMHFPREQQCIIDLLVKMEDNGVLPDAELEGILVNTFGNHAVPLRKLRRMVYWQGKFNNMNPWPWPKPMPDSLLDLAKIAISKIATADVQSSLTIFDTKDVKDSIDKTWIVSASSPDQERLIAEHPKGVAAYVEGPYKIWISKESVDYFILRADPRKTWPPEEDMDDISNIEVNFWKSKEKALAFQRCIHEQDEQTIFGICATGTSSKDSLLSWIRCLQPRNPALESIPILFKFITAVNDCKQIEPPLKDKETANEKVEEITS